MNSNVVTVPRSVGTSPDTSLLPRIEILNGQYRNKVSCITTNNLPIFIKVILDGLVSSLGIDPTIEFFPGILIILQSELRFPRKITYVHEA